MQIRGSHLTYCTNIHPGESWAEVKAALSTHVVAIKTRVAQQGPFGVGLRLSARALSELSQQEELAQFSAWLKSAGLYVFTLNVFPYGTFHGQAVKQNVYRPDWSETQRLDYTSLAARVLAQLMDGLPEALDGSLSTVPVMFRPRAKAARVAKAVQHIVAHAKALIDIERNTGRTLRLALEPEPCCFLETTADAISFLEDRVFSREGQTALAETSGLNRAAAERALRRHVGVCFDACHAAVEFEDALDSVERLEAAGIVVAKWQVSSGLRVRNANPARLSELGAFADDIYLHQVVVKKGRQLRRFQDLPDALERGSDLLGDEWRIHFHVPVFMPTLGAFEGTQETLLALFQRHRARPISRHLEVETYTWDVLPAEYRGRTVEDAVAEELRWVQTQLTTRSAP